MRNLEVSSLTGSLSSDAWDFSRMSKGRNAIRARPGEGTGPQFRIPIPVG